MLYLAAYKTNFSQIYDFWSRVISPNPQTGHNSRLLCVMPALFLNLRAAALQACQGSCKKKPSIFSAAHLLFIPFYIHQLKKKKKKKPQATFITPSLNYTIVIKRHIFNHSLCQHDEVVHHKEMPRLNNCNISEWTDIRYVSIKKIIKKM